MKTNTLRRKAHLVLVLTFLAVFLGSVVRAAGCQPAAAKGLFKGTSYLGTALACEFEKARSVGTFIH